MRGPDGRLRPEESWARVAYLRAVVAVYGPWTESKVISLEERKRAQARVYEARLALRRLEGEYRPTHVSKEPGGGGA